MDLTIRDWMVIIGVLLIFAVLVDAWRRVRAERRETVKLNLANAEEAAAPEAKGQEELAWLKELPNGGARVVERSDLLRAASEHGLQQEQKRESKKEPAKERRDESKQEPESSKPEARSEPVSKSEPAAPEEPQKVVEEEEVELVTGMSSSDGEPENLDWLDDMPATDGRAADKAEIEPGRLPRDIDPEVFMLNVVSRNPAGFKGEDILQILLACDLRFGDMSFFHRHEFEAGRGAIQFSVANMMQPGVFDIDHMRQFNTPGLVFFVTLPGPEDMMKAFDYMLETAQAVARNLEGDVLDETRSVMTKQTLEHNRQQIRDLERRMLAKAR
ncbi:MAG: cell division protein ZipA [Halioglobus sp.]